jgi:hypothetical protein
MRAAFGLPFALLAMIAVPVAAGMTEYGWCLHGIREDCATAHVDAKGRMICTATGKILKMEGECRHERVKQEDLRADDLEPEGLDDYLRWRYATQSVPDAVLQSMTSDMLRVFRNTFFAGHGRVFRDRTLDAFFRGFPWYKPRAGFRESDLSAVEKANVAKAAVAEAERLNVEKNASPHPAGLGPFVSASQAKAEEAVPASVPKSKDAVPAP